MGTMQNDAVLLTYDALNGEAERALKGLRARLRPEWAAVLVGPVLAPTNCLTTWVCAPDGSKEGWSHSAAGNVLRALVAAVGAKHHARVVCVGWGECGAEVYDEPKPLGGTKLRDALGILFAEVDEATREIAATLLQDLARLLPPVT